MAIEAVRNYSVGLQQAPKANLKSQQSFTSNPEVDEEKSNATKYMLGATALAAVIGLGIAGYKGKLGKGIQELLGGAEKAAEKGAKNTEDVATGTLASGVKKAPEKVTNKAADVVEEVTTNVSGEIGKVNDYFKKNGVDGKAFIDNNNPEQVVIITRNKDGYYKQVQSTKDFKFHDSSSQIDSDKNLSSVVIDKSTPIHRVEKVAANGVKTKIFRQNGKVHTRIETPDGVVFSRKSNGNKIESEVITKPEKYTIASGEPKFEDVKNSFFAVKLKEGLN